MLNRSHDLVTLAGLLIFFSMLLSAQAQELEFSDLKKTDYSLRARVYDPRSRRVRKKMISVKGKRLVTADGEADITTDDLILPGLIDLHDHVRFAYAPRFRGLMWPDNKRFSNRYRWQQEKKYKDFSEKHYRQSKTRMKAVELFGLLREAVGGTTSLANDVSEGLDSTIVRNLSGPTKRHGESFYLEDVVFFLERDDLFLEPPAFNISESALRKIRTADQVLLHLAEGRRDDPMTKREIQEFFDWAEANPDLAKKIVPVHVVGFERAHFRKLRDLGIEAVVWSPVSNMILYDQTMDVPAALAEGLTVALGTDWYPSGSDSLFDELRFAKIVSRRRGWKLKKRVLNDMVLRNPAHILGSERLGRLKSGRFADFVMVPWKGSLDLSLAHADVDNLKLVVIGGRPTFGANELMQKLLKNPWPSPARPRTRAYGLNVVPCLRDMEKGALEPLMESFLPDL